MTAVAGQGASAPAESAADERLAYRGPVQRLLTRPEIGALVGAAVIWLYFWLVSDVFGTAAGAANFLDVAAPLGIMAVAVSLLMIGGEFDLSAGAMTGATGMLVILLAIPSNNGIGGFGINLWIAIPLTFAFALGIGWFNGTLVERTGLPSFIVTLSTFFVLIGAKLGFAKLFTEKVIVEGLDEAAGYDFWNAIFGATWIRNEHILDSRDAIYAILFLIGATAVFWGVLELAFTRREKPNPTGLVMTVAGAAAALFGLYQLTETDTVADNWLFGAVVAVGVTAAAVGVGVWRFERVSGRGGLSLSSTSWRNVLIGLALLAIGGYTAVTLDSTDQSVIGFLLTVQGLRAIVFGVGAIGGVVLPILVARTEGRESPVTHFLMMSVASLAVVGIGFLIQSEAMSRKFRAEFFAVVLLAALLIFISGLMRLLFQQRAAAHHKADRLGKYLTGAGMVTVIIAVSIRLLYMTQEEADVTQAVFTYRVGILWFVAFAVGASVLLARTKFGSWTFAVGGNKKGAREVGVPAARTKTTLFMTVSVAAFLVGMLLAFRLNSIQANTGDGQEFLYIIAAVVGGNLLTGGYGSAAGAAMGALIMAMSFQGIPFSGWNSDWRFLFVGVILLLAVLVNNFVRSKAEESK